MTVDKHFLKKAMSKGAPSTSDGVNVLLHSRSRLLPKTETYASLSQNDVYLNERASSTKIRLTAEVNVIASNVLFNDVTEIVQNEGSDNVCVLNYSTANGDIKPYRKPKTFFNANNAVRDTQLSYNSGGTPFVYHCGRNIFNNHVLRNTSFKCVCDTNKNSDDFNTLKDMMRTANGTQVVDTVYFPTGTLQKSNINMHLYTADDVLRFEECVDEKLIRSHDGWYGFYNTSKLLSFNTASWANHQSKPIPLWVNIPLYNEGAGNFVDMYPTRDLFLFPPKYNEHRNRVEENWKVCVTYPFSSITSGSGISYSDKGFINDDVNSLHAVYYNENTVGDNGLKQLVVYSISKHGLNVGNTVNLYMTSTDGNTTQVASNLEVVNIIDDFIFVLYNGDNKISEDWVDLDVNPKQRPSTFKYDGKTYVYDHESRGYRNGASVFPLIENRWVNVNVDKQKLSYKKVIGGVESKYYVRLFARVPNFKFAEEKIDENMLYLNTDNLLKYSDAKHAFETHQSKLAFSKNIYSDGVGQCVFTDDIDVNYLRDNLGRPLTSIYLTFFKNNSGYKEWYGFNKVNIDPQSENVEFSHCFGAITCAFEMSDEARGNGVPSIKTIHNIPTKDFKYGLKAIESNFSGGTKPSERGLYEQLFTDTVMYGDLACYDEATARETVIQPILHRINTAQRESISSTSNDKFQQFEFDNIINDDYDANNVFKVEEGGSYNLYGEWSNKRREGYYYQPHYEVQIHTFGEVATAYPDFLTPRASYVVDQDTNTYRVSVLQNHFLNVGDKVGVCHTKNGEHSYYTLVTTKAINATSFEGVLYKYGTSELATTNDVMMTFYPDSSARLEYKFFKLDNLDIPSYANLVHDGSCRMIWRPVVINGMERGADEEYPFANGAFYVNKYVDIFMRRQDPNGINALWAEIDPEGDIEDINETDNYVKEEDITC